LRFFAGLFRQRQAERPIDPAILLAETAIPLRGEPRKTQESLVDVAEISKLDSYLKRLFGSPRIRVVPRPQRDDYAEVFLGDEMFGRIVVDDEDDERSYNFEKAITLSGSGRSPKLDNETVAKLNVHLKEQLGQKFSVRKRPTKTDSADLHAGDEFVGVVFTDETGFALEMAILQQDLEP
jgi:hypothetical protein